MNNITSVIPVLNSLGVFQYLPNNGNLGDLLIDVATRQLMRHYNLPHRHAECNHVVYGGGGRFVPFYGSLETLQKSLTHPGIERCVILPHSFYEVDSFVQSLDERHTVFCRESRSLEYCLSLNSCAKFLPAHDMSIHLNPVKLRQDSECHEVSPLKEKLKAAIQQSSFTTEFTKKKCLVGYFPRRGEESTLDEESHFGQDLSELWMGYGEDSPAHAAHILALLDELSVLDIVITDRLHMGIAALYAGCQVCFFDNNYGKISGVYQQTFRQHPGMALFSHDRLMQMFPELKALA